MKYRNIIWDWNGTILNDIPFAVAKTNQLLSKFGLKNLSHDEHRSIFTIPIQRYYELLGVDLTKVSFSELNSDFHKSYNESRHQFILQENARETITDFHNRGFEQSVLSALPHEFLKSDIAHFELGTLLPNFLGMQLHEGGHSKIENGKRWILERNHNPKEVEIIGDTIHDSEVAEELGCECILIAHGHQDEVQLKRTKRKILSSFKDLQLEFRD